MMSVGERGKGRGPLPPPPHPLPHSHISGAQASSLCNTGNTSREADMPLIDLPFGNNVFNSCDLRNYIIGTGRNFIIQGQVNCKRENHPKQNSLDCWLRDNYAQKSDTKQAVNEVIRFLVNTGDFQEGYFKCPDSGRKCKGVELVESSNRLLKNHCN
jgi:hypothetical protein